MNGILAIRLRALGDVVLCTPALRALRCGHPNVPLELVTDARYAPLLEGQAGIDRVWPLERTSAASVRLLATLRRRRYAWAVDLFGNPRSAMITWGAGARRTAGFDLRVRRFFYDLRVPRDAPAASGGREHASSAHMRLACAVGGIDDGEPARLELPAAARPAAVHLLEAAGVACPSDTVGLVAGGTTASRMWPVSHAAVFARRLLAEGVPVLLLTGPGEEAWTQAMKSLVPGLHVLPPCGVVELAGVVAQLRLVAGLDSGPRHIAAAVGVPTFTWYGPTHPETWQPRGERHGYWQTELPCRGCDRTVCPHWNCLPGLKPLVASARVLAHLETLRARPAGLGSAVGA